MILINNDKYILIFNWSNVMMISMMNFFDDDFGCRVHTQHGRIWPDPVERRRRHRRTAAGDPLRGRSHRRPGIPAASAVHALPAPAAAHLSPGRSLRTRSAFPFGRDSHGRLRQRFHTRNPLVHRGAVIAGRPRALPRPRPGRVAHPHAPRPPRHGQTHLQLLLIWIFLFIILFFCLCVFLLIFLVL